MLLTKCFLLGLVAGMCYGVPQWYLRKRRRFIQEEDARRLGANLILSDKEELLNDYLMTLKMAAYTSAVETTVPYPAGGHFFLYKDVIDNSTIFKIIEKMPKGGVLHVHSHAMTTLSWVVKTLTYLPGLYCQKEDGKARQYQFADADPGEGWELVSELRAQSGDPEAFDKMLESELTIFTKDPYKAYPSINDVWALLNNYFDSMGGFWDSAQVNDLYFREALQQFYADGVQYIEIRFGPDEEFVKLMSGLVAEFQQDHPDFIGVKYICAGGRYQTKRKLDDKLEATIALMKKYPDLVKGFDVVAQEDTLHTQRYYLNQLLEPQEENFTVPFFFHAGETDWTDAKDENLVDAVLLNAKRIGHGYALLRHPKVMERIRRKQIAVELNPISNQVLGLVNDLRNHPGAIHLANNDPVVVSSDDPVVWYASPLSHDFYMAFMALGSIKDDLRLMKQLAINSFKFSTMTEEEKQRAFVLWAARWDQFIDDMIEEYQLADFQGETSN